jgi:predicted amidohydrolase
MTFRLSTITIKTENDFSKNLDKIIKQIKLIENGYILAPELCLTGYSYDNLDEAAIFSKIAIKTLQELAINKIISITLTIKKDNKFYNNLHIFHKQKLIYTQPKVKLFTPNNEDKYFYAGKESDIKIIDIDGVKIATLICFELRFIKLWQQIQGADIILIPAMWGEKRKEHLLS